MTRNQEVLKWDGLVYHVARDLCMKNPYLIKEFEDLVQEGFIALIKVVEKKDKIRGSFITYAYKSIYNAMIKYIKEYVSRNVSDNTGDIENITMGSDGYENVIINTNSLNLLELKVFNLYYVENKTLYECSIELSIRIQTLSEIVKELPEKLGWK